MLTYYPYIAANFAETTDYITVTEKFTGKEYAKVGLATSGLLEMAISEAVTAEEQMRSLSSFSKSKILKYIADTLFDKREFFAEIIATEAGKPLKYARIEAERASQVFQIAAEEAKRIHSELLSLDWFSHGTGKEALIKLVPSGTIAAITPFNFPLNLVAHKVAPAIAAGCPVILKPSVSTPLSALELAKIIQHSGLPAGGFSVLPMTHETAKPLIEDERIKKISFTGSPQVGWKMKNECGRKKITLELGGNAAAIVTSGADLNEAVAKCVSGAFAFSGQVCIHTQRIFVQRNLFQAFLTAFIQRTKTLNFGNPLDEKTDISVMIDEENAIRVEQWINEAVRQGAVVVLGGARNGSYVEPTILTGTHSEMKVRKEEVFGPVVTIEQYENFDEAIDMVNDSEFGLQAGVFTNQIDEMNQAFNEIKAGGILINESPTFRIDHMPYGGVKHSGFGREGIKYAIHEMCEMKVLVKPC